MHKADTTARLTALGAILFPALHTVTDGIEWVQGGFSAVQLWLNYLAFLPLPAVVLGLFAVQRPRIGTAGLWGAIIYGLAFVYFAHTTLLALETGVPTYDALWSELGRTYTVHGMLMLCGGGLFGWATLKARVLPSWTAGLFLPGLAINLGVALLPVPDIFQTLGTTVRNAGLISMGCATWNQSS